MHLIYILQSDKNLLEKIKKQKESYIKRIERHEVQEKKMFTIYKLTTQAIEKEREIERAGTHEQTNDKVHASGRERALASEGACLKYSEKKSPTGLTFSLNPADKGKDKEKQSLARL